MKTLLKFLLLVVLLNVVRYLIGGRLVYLNHYPEGIRTFYRYSMLDALILFPLLGVANGLLYPLLLGKDRQ